VNIKIKIHQPITHPKKKYSGRFLTSATQIIYLSLKTPRGFANRFFLLHPPIVLHFLKCFFSPQVHYIVSVFIYNGTVFSFATAGGQYRRRFAANRNGCQ
jgi:hypothetical protein